MNSRPTAIEALAADPSEGGLVLDFGGVLSQSSRIRRHSGAWFTTPTDVSVRSSRSRRVKPRRAEPSFTTKKDRP